MGDRKGDTITYSKLLRDNIKDHVGKDNGKVGDMMRGTRIKKLRGSV